MNTSTLSDAELELACPYSEVPSDGSVVTRSVKGHSVAIARRSPGDETVVAFDSLCPHMQAPLRFGRVVEGEVICPWHFMRFDTVTGKTIACDKTIMKLRTFPVKVVDGNVYVQTTEG